MGRYCIYESRILYTQYVFRGDGLHLFMVWEYGFGERIVLIIQVIKMLKYLVIDVKR